MQKLDSVREGKEGDWWSSDKTSVDCQSNYAFTSIKIKQPDKNI